MAARAPNHELKKRAHANKAAKLIAKSRAEEIKALAKEALQSKKRVNLILDIILIAEVKNDQQHGYKSEAARVNH